MAFGSPICLFLIDNFLIALSKLLPYLYLYYRGRDEEHSFMELQQVYYGEGEKSFSGSPLCLRLLEPFYITSVFPLEMIR